MYIAEIKRTLAISIVAVVIVSSLTSYTIYNSANRRIGKLENELDKMKSEFYDELEEVKSDNLKLEETIRIQLNLIQKIEQEVEENQELIEEILLKLNTDNDPDEPDDDWDDIYSDEWLESLNFTTVDFNDFIEIDPDYRISIPYPNRVNWNQMNRSLERMLFKRYEEEDFKHFIHHLDFRLENFTTGTGGNRLIIAIWKIAQTERGSPEWNFTHLYAEQVGGQTTVYQTVFNQRVNGENTFVHIGPEILVPNQTYYATIIRYGEYIELEVYSDPERTYSLYSSGIRNLRDESYDHLIVSHVREYDHDKDNWSTGYIENLRISE
jgi:DNA repair exonuclease SbcCD nuclease subunit